MIIEPWTTSTTPMQDHYRQERSPASRRTQIVHQQRAYLGPNSVTPLLSKLLLEGT
jgi:hypothetical protein